jgi:hypothetical protein
VHIWVLVSATLQLSFSSAPAQVRGLIAVVMLLGLDRVDEAAPSNSAAGDDIMVHHLQSYLPWSMGEIGGIFGGYSVRFGFGIEVSGRHLGSSHVGSFLGTGKFAVAV